MKNILFILLLCSSFSFLQSKSIRLEPVYFNFDRPVEIVFDNSDAIYVVEKSGIIIKIDNLGNRSTFLDIEDRVKSNTSEQGLLGMALDPDFDTNGFLYVHYINSDEESIIARFSSDDTAADANSEEEVLTVIQPARNHNGGKLAFGLDGYLYIGIGDGGGSGDPDNNSQNRDLLLGKLLRIDVSNLPYDIPDDNPFINDPNTRDEIWALGLRNPWKFSFDQITGALYIADVGQNEYEEINFLDNLTGGQNYGWRCYEGDDAFNTFGCADPGTYDYPIFTYENSREGAGCSITGGYVYQGDSLSQLVGHYIYGDFCSGKIWSLVKNQNDEWVNEEIYRMDRFVLSTFGQDNNGEIYVASYNEGTIYRLSTLCDTLTFLESEPSFCFSSNDGSISITTPDPNYTFEIDGGSLDNLAGGEHKVSITDSNGCLDVYRVDVDFVFEFPTINVATNPINLCENAGMISMQEPDLQLSDELELHLYINGLFKEVIDGNFIISEAGVFTMRLYNSDNDCSSQHFEFVEVTLLEVPLVELSILNGTITATPGYSQYFWYLNGNPILSTSSNSFTPTEFGSYTVEVFQGGCASFSNAIFISSTQNLLTQHQLQILPNPNNGRFSVKGIFDQSYVLQSEIRRINGATIQSRVFEVNGKWEQTFDISAFPAGVYFLTLLIENQSSVIKLVKE